MIDKERLELFEDTYCLSESMSWEIFEAEKDKTGIVDGVSILGRAVGPFFTIDGKSQNNRFYERKLWDRAIKETSETVKHGQMLGTIGHEQPLDDTALLEGKVSHRVSKLWIDESKKIGMGEILILNTQSGRTLNTYLRGGVELAVSSRGFGKYNGEKEGVRLVDSKSYKLETFDIVRNPGISHARPSLVEDIKKDKNNILDNKVIDVDTGEKLKETIMKDEHVESLVQAKMDAQEALDQALTRNSELEVTVGTQKELIENLREEVDTFKKVGTVEEMTETKSQVVSLTEDVESMTESLKELEGYKHLGTVEEITELADRSKNLMDKYESLGSPEDIERVFDRCETLFKKYEGIGSPEEIESELVSVQEELDAYKELGTVDDINEMCELTEQFVKDVKEVGTLDEINKLVDLAEKYTEKGSLKEIDMVFDRAGLLVQKVQESKMVEAAETLARETGVTTEIATAMIEKYGADTAEDMLSRTQRSTLTERYRKSKVQKSRKSGSSDEEKIEESNHSRNDRTANIFARARGL